MAKPRSFAMPLSPELRRARAQLAAHRRWHGKHASPPDEAARLERAALDRRIDELVAAAPRMTPEQRAALAALSDGAA
jgi:hypothetical protein